MKKIAVALVLLLVLPLVSCSSTLDYQTLVQLDQNVTLLQKDLSAYVQADETLTEAQKATRLRTGEVSLALIERLKAQARR